ncbi:MAG: acetolactate synthase large subunit, partial [Clostridia bacterium]|nr:acetolactate synthase large subunit [Clostridia bacterium]
MLLSGADIIVRTLIEQGCETVFGYPGGQVIDLYDSLYRYQAEIRHVLTAHEQGAAHAADGYA